MACYELTLQKIHKNSLVYSPIYSNRPGYWSSFERQSFGTSLDDGSASSLLSLWRGYGHQHPQVSALTNIAYGQRDLKLYPFGCNMDERIWILWLLSYDHEKHVITPSESRWDVSSIETIHIFNNSPLQWPKNTQANLGSTSFVFHLLLLFAHLRFLLEILLLLENPPVFFREPSHLCTKGLWTSAKLSPGPQGFDKVYRFGNTNKMRGINK